MSLKKYLLKKSLKYSFKLLHVCLQCILITDYNSVLHVSNGWFLIAFESYSIFMLFIIDCCIVLQYKSMLIYTGFGIESNFVGLIQ